VSLKQGEDWPWQTHLFNVALYYEWAENHVDVSGGATPPTIEFSQAAGFKQLFDLYLNNNLAAPASSAHTSVNDAMTAFAQGKAAMVQNGNWSLSQIVNAPGAKIDGDDIAFIPLYIGASDEQDQGLCIGSENYYCINKYASPASQQASMDFLDWLYTSPEGIDLVNQELGFLPPFDTFDTETAAMGNQLTRQVLFWECGMENVHNLPWVFEVIPNQRFKNSLGGYLQQYAIGVLSWDELVAQTKASWAAEASHVEDGL
jgi:raffinose/stachyose/melibiose transport system substrate-binding protein